MASLSRPLLALGILGLLAWGRGTATRDSDASTPRHPPVRTDAAASPGPADDRSPALAAAGEDRHRGVAWVAGREPVTAADLGALVAANVSWIAQTPFGWQRDERSPEVHLATSGRVWWGESDEGLEATTRLAGELGIRTFLKPHLWLSRPSEGAWRADVGMASEAQWRLWFASYRRFVLHYAALAERLGIPVFCVGVELHRSVRERPDDWRRLVAEVREVYSGRLTYAANWHEEVKDVPFWDALDAIGVQAYFPLHPGDLPTVEELVAAWEPHVAELAALSARHGRPVIVTEVGYVSRPGAAGEPWLWPERRPGAPPSAAGRELQARAYEAFFRAFWHRPWLAGVYFWKWYPRPPGDGRAELDFTPQGKPAEDVMRRWFAGAR